MLAVGTNVWSPLFIAAALVVAVMGIWALIMLWRGYSKRWREADEHGTTYPSPVGPAILTIVIGVVYIVLLTLGWNVLQDVTTTMSAYRNPAETQEQKKVQEAEMPSREEMDQAKAEQRERSQAKPHEAALDNFDAHMQQEAEKIKKRSLEKQPTEK